MTRKRGIVDETARALRSRILSGELPPGTRLPPERELAPSMNTNRATLREALRLLEAQGLLRARQGSGVEVLDYQGCSDFGILAEVIRHQPPAEQIQLLGDVLRIRRMVCGEVAALAAERRDESDVDTLRRLLARQRGNRGDLLATLQTDVELIRALVVASKSLVNRLIFNATTQVVFSLVAEFPQLVHLEPDYLDRTAELVRAIDQQRPAHAQNTLLNLLQRSDRAVMSLLDNLTPAEPAAE